ncbi:aminotriazole resistance protein [Rhizobium halophilum]|uniref:aminotriazole resistance protein n=1 Tax=Rhizobium halophilum TaxID=2846852 RepID=UPI001EFD1048|nr:aminotriazole resistance protein [Rhizobium halophilum]
MMSNAAYAQGEGNTLFPIVLSIVAAAATGVLWAYANPIQLVPGVIQWRIFAFLPPLVGILLGWRSGFICGYIGTIVWSLLAGTFIPAHSLIIDGIMVGLTGLIPGLLFNPLKVEMNRITLLKIAAVCLIVGLIMVLAVSASLAYLGIFPFWWAMGYLGLSDIVPMIIGTPLLVIPALKILKSAHPAGFTRF